VPRNKPDSPPHWPFAVALLLTLIVAAGLRLYRLPDLPAGLHYDEAANGILASEIARGAALPVFIPSYTGKEVLFFYWTALWMKLLGVTPLALRLSAALVGLATVAATIWAVRELLHDQRDAGWIALLTGAFVATSFWHLVLSRYGFRAVTQPLLQALTVAALWRGLRLGSKRSFPVLLLAGLFCGLTAYTYLAARAFPVPLAAALLTLLVTDRAHRRARLAQLALFVAVAALTLAPLAHYWLTHPGSFLNRAQQVAATDWAGVWSGIRACAAMLFIKGDPYIRFNLPHRPLLGPVTAVLSLLGLVTLLKPQHPPSTLHPPTSNPQSATRVFLLTYLPTMLLPSALATGEITPSNLRAAGLLPFLYLLPALGISLIKAQIPKPNIQPPSRRAGTRPAPTNLQPPTSILHSLFSTLQPPTSNLQLSFVICHLSFSSFSS
jgi:4-amino-4-deoxy-L-arabinose transferase-like glycosyltransferase